MPARILILGGGSGGLLVAEQLWRKLRPGEATLTIVDKSDRHVFLAGLPWVAVGFRELEDIMAPLKLLEDKRGIRVVRATVQKIDAANQRVLTDRGALDYDYLIVALGAEPDYKAIEGIEETLAPWRPDRALRLREILAKMGSGVIVTGMVRPPFPCPPAPYEVAGQVMNALRLKGGRVQAKVVVPEPKPLSTMSPAISDALLGLLEEIGVEFIGGFNYSHIDAKNRVIVGSNGEKIKYDVLAVTPPFRPPRPVAESDLAGPNGWMVVDPFRGFRSRKYDNVYGIGDVVAPPLNLPMAGVVAHAESEPLAAAILADIRGISMGYGLKLYAACAMDLGATGFLPFCDFTPALLGHGPTHCDRVFEGSIVKLAKELFETYWFTQVIPRD